jgi:hypothetical protein
MVATGVLNDTDGRRWLVADLGHLGLERRGGSSRYSLAYVQAFPATVRTRRPYEWNPSPAQGGCDLEKLRGSRLKIYGMVTEVGLGIDGGSG